MPTDTCNVPLPFVLSAALLNVADRLITTLMTLVDAIYPIALNGSTPTFPEHAAHSLFVRLSHLIATLIRISNFGIRAPAKPATPKTPTQPAPITQRSGPAQRLPSRPGWLLEALPDIAPAIASDLAALVADPALTTLLADTPTLHRALRSILRSLGLPDTQPPPSSNEPPPSARRPDAKPVIPPAPAKPSTRQAAVPNRHAEINPSDPAPSHVQFVTTA